MEWRVGGGGDGCAIDLASKTPKKKKKEKKEEDEAELFPPPLSTPTRERKTSH